MNKYPMLQSGFVAIRGDYLTIPKDIGSRFKDFVIDKSHLRSNNVYHYSESMEDLYKEYLANPSTIGSFTYMDKLITSFNRLIPLNTVVIEWLELQQKSKFYTKLHDLFLRETFNYILHDVPRTTDIGTWVTLLQADTAATRVDVSKEVVDIVRSAKGHRSNTDVTFKDLIYKLFVNKTKVANENPIYEPVDGYHKLYDFVTVCSVMFGGRNSITNVRRK